MRTTAIFLIIVTLAPIASASSPREQIMAMHRETKIQLRMNDGESVKGRLVDFGADNFAVAVGTVPFVKTRQVSFSDVRSVRRTGMRPSTKVLLVVGIVAALVIVGILIDRAPRDRWIT
jgi:hypothetical protein